MSRISVKNRVHYESTRLLRHLTGINLQGEGLHRSILKDYKNKGPGVIKEVPRVAGLSDQEIFDNYIRKAKPVVITDRAKAWTCLKKWTPEFLKETYGDDKILISDTHAKKEVGLAIEHATLREVIECMERGDTSKYARFNDLLHRHPELINDVDAEWLMSMKRGFSSGGLFQIFIGAKGTRTSLHAAVSHNYFTQVYGRKHWYIVSAKDDPALRPLNNRSPFFVSELDPELKNKDDFPIIDYLDMYETELQPGDILYNPSSFWHHVSNPTDSIGLGYRWFGLDCLKINFIQSLLLFTASNPSVFYVMKNDKDYSKVFKYIDEKRKNH